MNGGGVARFCRHYPYYISYDRYVPLRPPLAHRLCRHLFPSIRASSDRGSKLITSFFDSGFVIVVLLPEI